MTQHEAGDVAGVSCGHSALCTEALCAAEQRQGGALLSNGPDAGRSARLSSAATGVTDPWRYFAFLNSRRICSSASMTSSRETRLRAKLSFRLNSLVGGLNANTKCFGRPAFGLAAASRSC